MLLAVGVEGGELGLKEEEGVTHPSLLFIPGVDLEGEVSVLLGGFVEGLSVHVRADVEAVKLRRREGGREGGERGVN